VIDSDEVFEARIACPGVTSSSSPTLGHLPGLLETGVDELLLHVLEDDGDARGGDHLSDLAAHGPSPDHGGFEDEHGAGG
jgi:hypothetical protein